MAVVVLTAVVLVVPLPPLFPRAGCGHDALAVDSSGAVAAVVVVVAGVVDGVSASFLVLDSFLPLFGEAEVDIANAGDGDGDEGGDDASLATCVLRLSWMIQIYLLLRYLPSSYLVRQIPRFFRVFR